MGALATLRLWPIFLVCGCASFANKTPVVSVDTELAAIKQTLETMTRVVGNDNETVTRTSQNDPTVIWAIIGLIALINIVNALYQWARLRIYHKRGTMSHDSNDTT